MTDSFGWIFSIVQLAGGYGVAGKRVWGLWAFLVGNLGWAVVGYLVGLHSLIAVSIAFAAMDLYAIDRWKHENDS